MQIVTKKKKKKIPNRNGGAKEEDGCLQGSPVIIPDL